MAAATMLRPVCGAKRRSGHAKAKRRFIVVTISVRPIVEAHMQQEVPLSHSTFRSCVRIECVPGMTKGGDLAK